MLRASLYQMILIALSQLNRGITDSKNHRSHLKRVQQKKKTVVLIKSSHSSDSRSSGAPVIGVPGFIQKRCSPGCSCASLGTCMQMSWVAALILSSLCGADILPGTETAQRCVRMLSGRSERGGGGTRGGSCSSHSRLNGSHQPITAWKHRLYSNHLPPPPTHPSLWDTQAREGRGSGQYAMRGRW